MHLCVHFLPQLTTAEQLSGSTVVVIDVLRATTTIAHALAAGAERVIPCREVVDARAEAAELGSASLLGGERRGLPIDGFHLSNSPADYTPERVAGNTIVFTTTNGTRAMEAARGAENVLLASFCNLSAVCHILETSDQTHLLCAGTGGEVTREDTLLAGAVVERLCGRLAPRLNDQALLAGDAWRAITTEFPDPALADVLRHTRGGRNLAAIGLEQDIDAAALVDSLDLVPRLDVAAWEIRA